MYNYLENIKSDIKEYAITEEIKNQIRNGERYEVEQNLNDDLWIDDNITGNASGSYYCNSWKAKEALEGNEDLIREMASEFCVDSDTIAKHFLNGDWEYFDVSIRCYLLGQAICEVLDEIESEEE